VYFSEAEFSKFISTLSTKTPGKNGAQPNYDQNSDQVCNKMQKNNLVLVHLQSQIFQLVDCRDVCSRGAAYHVPYPVLITLFDQILQALLQ
jgi:hypothetical protein